MKSNVLVRIPIAIGTENEKEAATDVSEKSNLSHAEVSEKCLCVGVTKHVTIRAMMNHLAIAIVTGLLIAPLVMFGAAVKTKPALGPTAENALAADQELARAMRDNDTVGIYRMLDKDWAVIATTGGIGEGPSIFPDGIRSGYLTRKTFSISEPRVRLYGNTAVVTTKVELSGTFKGKPFDVEERQTDVWCWKDGGWKCILTHETKMSK